MFHCTQRCRFCLIVSGAFIKFSQTKSFHQGEGFFGRKKFFRCKHDFGWTWSFTDENFINYSRQSFTISPRRNQMESVRFNGWWGWFVWSVFGLIAQRLAVSWRNEKSSRWLASLATSRGKKENCKRKIKIGFSYFHASNESDCEGS